MPQWMEWEIGLLDWIQQSLRGPVLDALLPAITTLGNAGAIWIVLGLVLLIPRKRREQGAVILIALGHVRPVGQSRPEAAGGQTAALLPGIPKSNC